MKIELDTNEDSYADWLQAQRFLDGVYQTRCKRAKEPCAEAYIKVLKEDKE